MVPEGIRQKPELLWARRLVWLYFWLLIAEGILLSYSAGLLANLLLAARDVAVIVIYALVAARHRFPSNGFVATAAVLAGLLGISTMVWGHGNSLTMLYGLRTNFLHLPLIFVIGDLFSLDDVRRFGKTLLWASLPIAVLIVLQFLLAGCQNTGSGSVTGSFLSTVGLSAFLAFQCAFIAAFFLEKHQRMISVISLVALIFAVVCSINPKAVWSVIIVLLGSLWAIFLNPKRIHEGFIFLAVVVGLTISVSFSPVFRAGSSATSNRFEEGTPVGKNIVAGVLDRFWEDMAEPWQVIKSVNLTGAGTGAGINTNATRTGENPLILAHHEWSRLLLESGLVLGLALIGLRIFLSGYLFYWGYRCLKNSDNFLPWVLCFAIVPLVFAGIWGHPSVLGFACLGGGLILAATRPSYAEHPLFKYAYSALKK